MHRPSHLMEFADSGQYVRLEGVVIEETKRAKDSQIFVLRAYKVKAKEWKEVDEKVQVIVKTNFQRLFPGMRVLVMGKLSEIRGFRTPGAFKTQEKYNNKGIYTRLTIKDGRYLVFLDNKDKFPGKWLQALREDSLSFLTQNLPEGINNLACAILLGEKAPLSYETKELFSKAGLSHVLVVSGLHIGLVMAVSFFSIRWALRYIPIVSQWHSVVVPAFFAGGMVILYTYLTGLQISGTRAMIMSLMCVISLVIFRLTDPWTTLCFAGILIVAMDPHRLFSLSFQLSFLSVVGILWTNRQLVMPLSNWFQHKNQTPWVPRKLIIYATSLLLLSVGTNLFILPILVYNFNQFSIVGVLSNIVCVPILGALVVPFGIASIIMHNISSNLAEILLFPCGFGIHLIDVTATNFGSLSYSAVYWVTPYLFEIVVYYLILAFTFISIRHHKMKTYGLICLLCFLVIHIIWVNCGSLLKKPGLEISFLDVGQGSASVIRLENHSTFLVDAGGIPNVEYDIGKEVVSRFLWHNRIRKIDAAILTHADTDHSGGYDFILKAFNVREFWAGGDLPQAIKERIITKNITLVDVSKKDRIETAKASFEFIHPKNETLGFCKDENDRSLVFRISYKDFGVLITGDNGKEVLSRLSQMYGTKMASEILLVPHHGSKNSLSMEFLKAVNPKLAIVSCGIRNPFKFPHPEVLDAFKKIKARIISTKNCGTVTVRLDPKTHEIKYQPHKIGNFKVKNTLQEDLACSGRLKRN